jgi:putative transposase
MVSNFVKFVPWKDYKAVTVDLKRIYQSMTEEEALLALDQFAERWDEKYPLNTLFNYPVGYPKSHLHH